MRQTLKYTQKKIAKVLAESTDREEIARAKESAYYLLHIEDISARQLDGELEAIQKAYCAVPREKVADYHAARAAREKKIAATAAKVREKGREM